MRKVESRQIRVLLAGRSKAVLILALVSVAAGVVEAGMLALVAHVAAALVTARSAVATVGPQLSVGAALAAAAGLAGARLLLQLAVAWLPARLSAGALTDWRRRLFGAFTEASYEVQAEERDGHLQELLTNQVCQAAQAVIQLATMISAGAMFLALVVSSFLVDARVAAAVLAASAGVFLMLRPLNRFGRRAAATLSAVNVEHAVEINEVVQHAEETQVFGVARGRSARVGDLIDRSSRGYQQLQFAVRAAQGWYQGMLILLLVGVLALLYTLHLGQVAGLGAIVLMLVRASGYGQQLQSGYLGLTQCSPYVERLEGAIQHYRRSSPPAGTAPLRTVREIRLEQVGYTYGAGRRALRDVGLTVKSGEVVGISGASGAGKSTLVHVLLGLREPRSGRYLVNGVPLTEVRHADWQRLVAYVPQDPKILHGTVTENIRYLRDVDMTAVQRAARLAHIDREVLELAEGYDTVIGPRAKAVSGGQRQRICLARALVAEPELLVLDEPTSALDATSAAAVHDALHGLRGRMTIVIVSHRRSLLEICDRVIDLADGSVVGTGGRAALAAAEVAS